MEGLQILSRNEMKNIMAGGGCRAAWRNADGSFAGYSSCSTMSPGQLDDHFNDGFTNDDGQYVSGWCCASCGVAGSGFENTSPCYL